MSEKIHQTISQISDYERARGEHSSGTFGPNVLLKIAELAPATVSHSVETGCGKSTILFSHLSQRHVVFAVDDSVRESGSLPFVRYCPLFRADVTEFELGPTQKTLPKYSFVVPIDLALIDGPHGYPYPDLEYYFIYPHLRPGALLIVDDLHIPTIARMYEIIREDAMFDELHVEDHTGFLRRTAAPTFPPTEDRWNEQNYNIVRFPVLSHVKA
jgi:Methyltransferase domain